MSDNKISSAKAFKGFIWYFFSKMFPALSGLLIFSLTSRGISPAELGAITLSVAIVTFLVFLSFNGYGDALVQIKELTSKHISTVTFLTLFSSIVLYAISLIFVKIAITMNILQEQLFYIYLSLGIKCVLDALSIVPVSILTRRMEFKSLAVRTLYTSISATVVSIPVYFYWGGVVALIVNYLFSSLLGLLIAWKTLELKFTLGFDKNSYKELTHVGGSTTAAKVITSVNFDNIMIGFFGSATTLGNYSFSKRVFGIFTDILSGSISSVTYPIYSRLQSDTESLKRSFLSSTFLSAAIGFPCYIGLILISPYLIPVVFGEHWSSAIPVLQVSCLLGFITCIGSLQVSLIKGMGRAKWVLYYQMIQQVSTIVLCCLFSQKGPLVIMSLITIKTYIIWPFTAIYISKILNIGTFEYIKNIQSSFFSGLIMFGVFVGITPLIKDLNVYLFIIIQMIVCIFVYVVCIYLLEKKRINQLIDLIRKK